MGQLTIYGWVALVTVLVGGLCWGLVGLFDVQIITALFGTMIGRLIYIAVGVASGYLCYLIYLVKFKKN